MNVQIDRTETGTTVHAKETNRYARIVRVITRCQPDGFSLTLYEAFADGAMAMGHCHIPAFRMEDRTVQQLEAAASQWVAKGVIVAACQPHPLE